MTGFQRNGVKYMISVGVGCCCDIGSEFSFATVGYFERVKTLDLYFLRNKVSVFHSFGHFQSFFFLLSSQPQVGARKLILALISGFFFVFCKMLMEVELAKFSFCPPSSFPFLPISFPTTVVNCFPLHLPALDFHLSHCVMWLKCKTQQRMGPLARSAPPSCLIALGLGCFAGSAEGVRRGRLNRSVA